MTEVDVVRRASTIAAVALATVAWHVPAARADIDCKVILCLAGGFPTGCADAYRYMIDRLASFPPRPPFGICSMSDGRDYTAHHTSARYLTGRDAHVCPGGGRLYYRRWWDDDNREREEAFCYERTRQRQVYDLREGRWRTVTDHLGRTGTHRVDYELRITVEPGTPSEFRSPTYRIHTRTGFVHQEP